MKLNKKHIWIIGIISILIISTILLIVFLNKNTELFGPKTDQDKFKIEYESLNREKTKEGKRYTEINIDADNKMKYINISESLDILDHGTAVIYIGHAECLYCRNAVQILINTAKNMEIETINYLDISKIWDIKELNDNNEVVTTKEANENYDKLLEELGEELIENYILIDKDGNEIDTGEKRAKIPLVVFVVDGDIVSYNVGTLSAQEDPYKPLDEDQIESLSYMYRYGIKDVLRGLKTQQNLND